MEAEAYQQSVYDGAAESARLVTQLGWLTLGGCVCVFVLWFTWRCREQALGLLNGLLAAAMHLPRVLPLACAVFVRHAGLRWTLAWTVTAATFAVGVTAGVLQLDGGWWDKYRRFWCWGPLRADFALRQWAGGERVAASQDADLDAWVANQDQSQPFGRAVAEIAKQLKEERANKRRA